MFRRSVREPLVVLLIILHGVVATGGFALHGLEGCSHGDTAKGVSHGCDDTPVVQGVSHVDGCPLCDYLAQGQCFPKVLVFQADGFSLAGQVSPCLPSLPHPREFASHPRAPPTHSHA